MRRSVAEVLIAALAVGRVNRERVRGRPRVLDDRTYFVRHATDPHQAPAPNGPPVNLELVNVVIDPTIVLGRGGLGDRTRQVLVGQGVVLQSGGQPSRGQTPRATVGTTMRRGHFYRRRVFYLR